MLRRKQADWLDQWHSMAYQQKPQLHEEVWVRPSVANYDANMNKQTAEYISM